MKKALLIAVAALSTTSLTAQRIETDDEAVQLFMKGGGACSGTLVGNDTVLTAGHCIQSTTDYIAVNKRRGVSKLLKPKKIDKARDLAILTANGAEPDLSRINFGKAEVVEGETITAVGFGLGLPDKDELSGRVIGLMPHPLFNRTLAIASDGRAIPGMSGGPVVDTDNKLIGVVSAGNDLNDGDSVRKSRSLFIPITEIQAFLKAPTEKDSPNVIGSALTPEEELLGILSKLIYRDKFKMRPLDKVVLGGNKNDQKLNRPTVRQTR